MADDLAFTLLMIVVIVRLTPKDLISEPVSTLPTGCTDTSARTTD